MRRLFLIFLLLYSNCILAQHPVIQFHRFKIQNGPRTGLKRIYQDNYGYIWLGTWHSLSRFDGYQIRYYTAAELSNAQFASKCAKLVFEDKQKRLWIATDRGALMLYNRDTDRFELVNDSTRSLKAAASSVAEDEKGNFWIGTSGAGVFYYEVRTGALKHYASVKSDPETIPGNDVNKVVIDQDKNLWVGTTQGLSRYDHIRDRFIRYALDNRSPDDGYQFERIQMLQASEDGKLYIGSDNGFHIFDTQKLRDRHLLHDPKNPASLSHNRINDVRQDRYGKIWIATYGGGLDRYDPVSETFDHWITDPDDPQSLPSNNLSGIYFDRDENLWVATVDHGLAIADPRARKIRTIRHNPYDAKSISDGTLYALFPQDDSILWVGINGGGLNRLNIYTQKVTRYLHQHTDRKSLGSNTLETIGMDRNKNLWVGLYNGGINMMNIKTGRFDRYPYSPANGGNGISNEAVGALYIDPDNILWLTHSKGLEAFDIDRKKFRPFPDDSLKHQIGFSLRGAAVGGKKNLIWLVSSSGVALFDKDKKQFVSIPVLKGKDPAAPVSFCFAGDDVLILDNRNRIRRVHYISPEQIKHEIVYTLPGMERFLAIATDPSGNLWGISTKKLLRVNLKEKTEKVYAYFEDVPSEPIKPELFSDAQGRIFFSLFDEINWFHPDNITDEKVPQRLVFTTFKVFNKVAAIGDDNTAPENEFHLPKHISRLSTLELSYKETFFSFEFSALHYLEPEKIRYAYKLEGFNKEWIYLGHQRYASYTSLDPGSYVFKVKAENSQGVWCQQIASIKVIIRPPFWKTWWFITLEVFTILVLCYAAHCYRLAQSVKLERLRNKIATDLHDEVGSSLTQMSIYSNMLVSGLDEGRYKKYLHHINDLSREIVNTMSDIVWSVDNRDGSLGELILRMKSFANDVLNVKNIDTTFTIHGMDEKQKLDPVLKQNLYLIFKESINNIVKHAEANQVTVVLNNDYHGFLMKIHDNGKGARPEGNEKGNGFRNMRKRAMAINAQLLISNHPGTTILLKRKRI